MLPGLVCSITTALLTVCPSGCTETSIRSAVEHANPGDTIEVREGLYAESGILIEKLIHLKGLHHPILDGGNNGTVLIIRAPLVTVEGFTIQNSGASYTEERAGIRVEDTERVTISGNSLGHNAYGIYLANSERCIVRDNTISGNIAGDAEAGNGIHSWKGAGHILENNTVSNHRDGIYLEFTNDSRIADNTVTENRRYGLHFMTSHRNDYLHNSFTGNGAGVAVMYSRNIKMIGNSFANNRGVASYGLLLKDISLGEVNGNTFDDNTFGVYMEDTNRSQFSGNRFLNNGYGLRVLGNCDNNTFTHNNFQNNTFDVATNSSRNPNTFTENFWNSYEGYDLDGDGRGDIPYRPVSLSSIVTEKVDSSFPLIRSPLFLVLDQIEQAFPMLIPETLKDEAPLMAPWQPKGGI